MGIRPRHLGRGPRQQFILINIIIVIMICMCILFVLLSSLQILLLLLIFLLLLLSLLLFLHDKCYYCSHLHNTNIKHITAQCQLFLLLWSFLLCLNYFCCSLIWICLVVVCWFFCLDSGVFCIISCVCVNVCLGLAKGLSRETIYLLYLMND